jgi:hypothetical protein
LLSCMSPVSSRTERPEDVSSGLLEHEADRKMTTSEHSKAKALQQARAKEH